MKNIVTVVLASAAGILAVSGCKTSTPSAPTQSGFLSHYHSLQQVEPNRWVYLNKDRLGSYNKFIVEPVKVLFTEYQGTPLTDEQRHKTSEYVRNTAINALRDRYPVVTAPSTDTAEIRIAVTDAFRQGGQFGLTIEAEIIDSYTAVQVGAVMRTALGQPYLGSWWDSESAKEIVGDLAKRLRQVIDDSRR
jgi:hypothetical protein